MKYIYTIILILTVSITYAQQKVYQLGSRNNDMLRKMAFDKEGNIIITGSFEDTASFAGVKFTSLNRNAAGTDSKTSLDVFILKMDKAGKVLWHKNFGGHFKSYPNQVAVDENDNIILAGQFTEKFTTGNSDTLRGLNGWNGFIVKMDKDGKFLWQKSLETKAIIEINSLKTNSYGEIFTVINNTDTFIVEGNKYFISDARTAVQKIDVNGKLLWNLIPNGGKLAGVQSPTVRNVLISNKDKNIILTLYTGKEPLLLNDKKIMEGDSINRILLIALNEKGDFQWQNTAAVEQYGSAFRATQDKEGNIFTLGYFGNELDFGNVKLTAQRSGTNFDHDTYLAKYSPEGKPLWAKSMGIKGEPNYPNALTVDANGYVYIANQYDNNYNLFDTTLKTGAMTDTYIARISPDGNLEKIISTKGSSTASITSPRDILISDDGSLYVAGVFNYVTNFGGSTLQSKSRDDGFLWVIPQFTVGIDEDEKLLTASVFSVYPNPTNGVLNIIFKNALTNASTLKLYSITGQEIFTQSLATGIINLSINLENKPKGIYFLNLHDGKTIYSQKLIVQ